jgi:hypothetical protein
MEKVIEYYKLCSIKPKSKQLIPLVNQIQKNIVNIIFTRKHVEGFLDEREGVYYIRESVIGAGEDGDDAGGGANSINHARGSTRAVIKVFG